jgi:hypothetical protein
MAAPTRRQVAVALRYDHSEWSKYLAEVVVPAMKSELPTRGAYHAQRVHAANIARRSVLREAWNSVHPRVCRANDCQSAGERAQVYESGLCHDCYWKAENKVQSWLVSHPQGGSQ